MGRTKKVIKVGKISCKDDILIFEKKRVVLIGNKTKRSLEMTTQKIELEKRWLKATNIPIEKRIEK